MTGRGSLTGGNESPLPCRRLSEGQIVLPRLIVDAGEQATRRFLEFFAANIRNRNTRLAYAKAVRDFTS